MSCQTPISTAATGRGGDRDQHIPNQAVGCATGLLNIESDYWNSCE